LTRYDHKGGSGSDSAVNQGRDDNVEKIGGRPPMTPEAFITKNRAAFV
jgi:hypothetical protein